MAGTEEQQEPQTSTAPTKQTGSQGRRIAQIVLILGVTIGCIAYAVQGMAWGEIKASFGRANYISLLPMMLILFSFYAIKAWRWALLVRPIKPLSPQEVTPALMIGFMANNLLPAHLGGFVRVFVLGKQYDLEKTAVLSTVVLERVFDILAILLLLGISLPFISGMPPEIEAGCKVFGIASMFGVLVLLVYMAFTQWFVGATRSILSWLPFIPSKLSDGIVRMLESGALGLNSVRSPRLLAGIVVSSVAQWILNAAMIFASMWAFGVDGTYFQAVLVMGVIVFAILLPSTPGYFGVIQACFAAALGKSADVFGASVYYHMCQYIPVTLVGFFFMNRIGLSLGGLQSEAADSDPETAAAHPESPQQP